MNSNFVERLWKSSIHDIDFWESRLSGFLNGVPFFAGRQSRVYSITRVPEKVL
jgi:hypothetical protein